MELRNYQIEAIELIEGHMMFDTVPCCLAAPTSFGKTITSAHLIKDLVAEGKHVVFLVNLTSLIDQTTKTLDALDIKYNVLAASYKGAQGGPAAKVTIAMQQTMSSRLDEMSKKGTLPACDILIVDEMHISHDTQTMNDVKNALRPSNIIGLSATPIDGSGLKLKNVEVIETQNTHELTQAGYLTKADTHILKYAEHLDFSDIGSGADYTDPEVDAKLNNDSYNQAVFDGWKEYRQGAKLKTIVFVSSIEHAKSMRDLFNDNGIVASEYHSKMTQAVRQVNMDAFKDGLIEVMISVSSLIAGFDMPDIECGIMCRPTKRARTYLQAVGRILRLHPSKESAIWIDAAQITSEHGLYDNPYNFKIDDKYELKKYKQSRRYGYMKSFIKEPTTSCLKKVTKSRLEAHKAKIEGDSSLEGLIERYDACMDIGSLLVLGFRIAKLLGQPSTNKTLVFVEETCIPYVREGGSLKAIKTRMRNIIKDGKKLAALHYFPEWLKEQNWN